MDQRRQDDPATVSPTRVVHCRKEKYDVYIGRPGEWGNPFVIGKDGSRADVIQKYREAVEKDPEKIQKIRNELAGKVLGCWCKPHNACHGDVLAEIADKGRVPPVLKRPTQSLLFPGFPESERMGRS